MFYPDPPTPIHANIVPIMSFNLNHFLHDDPQPVPISSDDDLFSSVGMDDTDMLYRGLIERVREVLREQLDNLSLPLSLPLPLPIKSTKVLQVLQPMIKAHQMTETTDIDFRLFLLHRERMISRYHQLLEDFHTTDQILLYCLRTSCCSLLGGNSNGNSEDEDGRINEILAQCGITDLAKKWVNQLMMLEWWRENLYPNVDRLKCQVCQDVTNGQKRLNVLIPCGHIICQDCCRQINGTCPYCRTSYRLSQPVYD